MAGGGLSWLPLCGPSAQGVSALRFPGLGLQRISAVGEKFEVQEGNLSGAQDFVAAVELQTAGGLSCAAWPELLLPQPPSSAGRSSLSQRISGGLLVAGWAKI